MGPCSCQSLCGALVPGLNLRWPTWPYRGSRSACMQISISSVAGTLICACYVWRKVCYTVRVMTLSNHETWSSHLKWCIPSYTAQQESTHNRCANTWWLTEQVHNTRHGGNKKSCMFFALVPYYRVQWVGQFLPQIHDLSGTSESDAYLKYSYYKRN